MDFRKISLDILRDLYGCSRRLTMYPLGHPVTQETLNKPLELLGRIFSIKQSFNIEFFKNNLIAEGILLDDTVYVSGLSLDMKKHKLDSISFYSDLKMADMYHFLSALVSKPGTYEDNVEKELSSRNITGIKINNEKLLNLFHFNDREYAEHKAEIELNRRVKKIISQNPSMLASYYLGRITEDKDILKYVDIDFRLKFLAGHFKNILTGLDAEHANKLLEDIVLSTNWLDDDIDPRAIDGLKRLFDDYLSQQENNKALEVVYQLFKKVGAPENIINRIFDQPNTIKLKTYQESERIIETLEYSDPSKIDPDHLKKTVFKLASANKQDYLFDILDRLMESLSGNNKFVRQQGLNLLVIAGETLSAAGFFEEFATLCRNTVRLALMPDDILEPVELCAQIAILAMKKKKWQELKFLVRTLKGISNDHIQPDSKRKYVTEQLLQISESNYLQDTMNELLTGEWNDETGEFFEAFANLGSTKVIHSLAGNITNPDINIRSRIIKILVSMKSDAAEVVSQLLSDEVEKNDGRKINEEKWYYLRNLLRVLKEVNAEESLPSLEIMAGWPDTRLKLEIVKTLEGMPVGGTAKLLQVFADDDNLEIKKAAVIAMGLSGDPDMIPGLENIFNKSRNCRVMVAAALGRIGGPAARDKLIALFENEPLFTTLHMTRREIEEVRVAILKALSRIGDSHSLAKLEEYSKKNFSKSLFKKDMLSNTAKIVLGLKSK